MVVAGTACAPDPPAAVVGIVVDGCDPVEDTGSGIVVAPGLVLTSAHVLAGAERVAVTNQGRSVDGRIVAFDPEMDLAYVAFDGLNVEPLPVAGDHVRRNDRGVAYVVRDREVVVLPVHLDRRVRIRTEDIYVEGETVRPGFELSADIRAGDSGGAVVVDGIVVGVLWARSRRFDGRAYAIDATRAADLIDEQLASGSIGPDIDIARCR